jgi:hypothetical protein
VKGKEAAFRNRKDVSRLGHCKLLFDTFHFIYIIVHYTFKFSPLPVHHIMRHINPLYTQGTKERIENGKNEGINWGFACDGY